MDNFKLLEQNLYAHISIFKLVKKNISYFNNTAFADNLINMITHLTNPNLRVDRGE